MSIGEFRPIYDAPGTLPVRLEVADVEHPPGNHYVHHRLVVGDGRPAVIIAASDIDPASTAEPTHEALASLLLVRSYRSSVGADLWELPRGSSDAEDLVEPSPDSAANKSSEPADYSDATLIQAGLRELHEETGYTGQNARVIGRYVADTTVFPQRAGVVQCTVDRDATPAETDGEVDEVRWFTMRELRAMVAGGEIRDSHTLSALAFLAANTES